MDLLIKYEGNWADEMDVRGFYTTTREEWDSYVQKLRKHFETKDTLMYYIGTNEEIEYTSADEVLRDHKVIEITPEQAATLQSLFAGWRGSVTFGFVGPDVE